MRAMLLLIAAAMSVTGCSASIPGLTAAAPSGSELYRDDFASASSGWDRVRHDGGIMDYDSGSYRMLVTAPDSNLWSTPGRKFGDVRIEVDANKLAGPDANRIGLICRSDGSSHYFFLISSDGYYGMGIFTDGEAALLGQPAMEVSPAIARGAAPNHLRMDCAGSQLAGYVNEVKVAQTEDARLKNGEVGILAGDFEEPGADIVFDNFVVLQP